MIQVDKYRASKSDIIDEVHRLKYLFDHSSIIRHGLNRDTEKHKTQSVAEHIYNMLILCDYFYELEDSEEKWDKDKIHKMILLHDIAELEVGDTKKHEKTKEVEKKEGEALETVYSKVPLRLKDQIKSITTEYELRESIESKFVKALDVLEVVISTYGEVGKKRFIEAVGGTKDVLDFYQNIQARHIAEFPIITQWVDILFEIFYKEHYYK